MRGRTVDERILAACADPGIDFTIHVLTETGPVLVAIDVGDLQRACLARLDRLALHGGENLLAQVPFKVCE